MKKFIFNNAVEFPKLTRTAKEAADALGCQIEQIAKSIIFKTKKNQKPILVIASGPNRVNEQKIKLILGEEIEKANADFVKEKTGFVIGGVPPWGHKEKIITFIDKDLEKYATIWASSGKTNSVFELSFEDLIKNSHGKVVNIS